MASSKGSSNSNKTAHVMNLLRKSNSPLEAPKDEAETPAAPVAAAPQAPIITALNADTEVSTQIRDALSDALAEEIGEVPAPVQEAAIEEETAPEAEAVEEVEPGTAEEPTDEVEAEIAEEVEPEAAEEAEPETVEEAKPEVAAEDDAVEAVEPEVIPEPVQEPVEEPQNEPDPEPEEVMEQKDFEDEAEVINVMYQLALDKLDKYIKMFGLCNCQRCRNDVLATALNTLPPKYLVIKPADLTLRGDLYAAKYGSDITAQILHACKQVMDTPRH